MTSASGRFVVKNRLGLHARAASKLVMVATRYRCDITVGRDAQRADAKSVMGVLLLVGAKGTVLEVSATGDGAEEAVREIGELIDSGFGETG